MQKVKLKAVLKRFNLNVINCDQDLLYNEITSPSIKRVGLDLAGMHDFSRLKGSVILWSSQECAYFTFLGLQSARNKMKHVLESGISLLILARGMDTYWRKIVTDEATKCHVPVVDSSLSSTAITTSIGIYLMELLSPEVQLHGTLLQIYNIGILLVGDPGSGKSEIALELIQQGHKLIADDAVLVTHVGNRFIGKSPMITKNILEVRGVGLLDIQAIYGYKSVLNRSEINFVVKFDEFQEGAAYDRLGDSRLKYWIGNWWLPMKKIPIKSGRSVSSLIEACANDYILRKQGINVLDVITERSKVNNE